MIKRIGILFIFLNMVAFSAEFSLEDILDKYFTLGNMIENKKIDMDIQKIRKQEIEQKGYRNLEIMLKPTYVTKNDNFNFNTKITFNDFSLYVVPIINNSGLELGNYKVVLGMDKKINDFIFENTKHNLKLNNIDTKISELDYRANMIKEVSEIIDKYLEIKEIERNIAFYKESLKLKYDEVNKAKLKFQYGKAGKSEIENAEIEIKKINVEIEKLNINYLQSLEDLKKLVDIDNIEKLNELVINESEYKIFLDDTSYKKSLLNLEKEEENLKSIIASNYPQSYLSLSYDTKDKNFLAGVTVTLYPFNYEGNKKESEKRILKQKKIVEQEKENLEKKYNEIKKTEKILELTKNNAYEDLEIYKKEFEKYKIMYENDSISQYDLFLKEEQYKAKMNNYMKAENELLKFKIKNIILNKYFLN